MLEAKSGTLVDMPGPVEQYVEQRYAKQLTSAERDFISRKLAMDDQGRIKIAGLLSLLFLSMHISVLTGVISVVTGPGLPQLASVAFAAVMLYYTYRKSKKALLLMRIAAIWGIAWAGYNWYVVNQVLNSGLLPSGIYESTQITRSTLGISVAFSAAILLYSLLSFRAKFTLLEP